jgi:nicotinamidase-related amidase
MSDFHYDASRTGLLLVDPYNDFLSEGGKLWPMVKEVAGEVGLLDNMRSVVAGARAAGVRVFFVPHRRWEPGDGDDWNYPNPSQRSVQKRQTFAKGSWGGEWHPDFVPKAGDILIKEHWAQSGFANTDLDFQLKQRGVTHVIPIGLLANTCIEATARFAMELGYHVTLVRDATAAWTHEIMHASHELNGPTFAHAIVTTKELLAALTPAASRSPR